MKHLLDAIAVSFVIAYFAVGICIAVVIDAGGIVPTSKTTGKTLREETPWLFWVFVAATVVGWPALLAFDTDRNKP